MISKWKDQIRFLFKIHIKAWEHSRMMIPLNISYHLILCLVHKLCGSSLVCRWETMYLPELGHRQGTIIVMCLPLS